MPSKAIQNVSSQRALPSSECAADNGRLHVHQPPSATCDAAQRHLFTRAVDSAVDAAGAVRDSIAALQLIEYRQRRLTERLIGLSHVYAELYRCAAKGVAAEAAAAVARSAPAFAGEQVAHRREEASNGDDDDILLSVSVIDADSRAAAAAEASAALTALPVAQSVIGAFAPLLHAAAASAAGAGMLASPTGASPSAPSPTSLQPAAGSAAKAPMGADAALISAVSSLSPVAVQANEVRAAIRAIEAELEALGAARNEIVAAIAVV